MRVSLAERQAGGFVDLTLGCQFSPQAYMKPFADVPGPRQCGKVGDRLRTGGNPATAVMAVVVGGGRGERSLVASEEGIEDFSCSGSPVPPSQYGIRQTSGRVRGCDTPRPKPIETLSFPVLPSAVYSSLRLLVRSFNVQRPVAPGPNSPADPARSQRSLSASLPLAVYS